MIEVTHICDICSKRQPRAGHLNPARMVGIRYLIEEKEIERFRHVCQECREHIELCLQHAIEFRKGDGDATY